MKTHHRKDENNKTVRKKMITEKIGKGMSPLVDIMSVWIAIRKYSTTIINNISIEDFAFSIFFP